MQPLKHLGIFFRHFRGNFCGFLFNSAHLSAYCFCSFFSFLSGGRFGGNTQEGALQPRFGHQGSYCSKTSSDCSLSGDKSLYVRYEIYRVLFNPPLKF